MHDLPLSSRHDSSEASGTQIPDAEVRILPPVFMIIPRLIARDLVRCRQARNRARKRFANILAARELSCRP